MKENKTGCIMLNFSKSRFSTLVDIVDIDSAYLVEDGIEETPHITVVYGIDVLKYTSKEDMEFIKNSISESGIMDMTLNIHEISTFSNPKYDTLKFDFLECSVINKIRDLNRKFTKRFNVESDFDEYNPHATLARVQKGIGKEYNQELNSIYPMKISKAIFSYRPDPEVKEFSSYNILHESI